MLSVLVPYSVPSAQNIYTPILPMIQNSFHTSLYLVNVTVSLLHSFLRLCNSYMAL